MSVHQLKAWPEPFQAIIDGNKRHEIRKADRDYKTGDVLLLREYRPDDDTYTGRLAVVIVKYLTVGGSWGLPDGMCVMSITSPSEDRISTLATNLAWAASLCRAFTLGARRGFDVGAFPEIVSDEWRPGCQRQAP